MRKERPSQTAKKVALSLISLSRYKGWDDKLPEGMLEATKKLLITSGACSEHLVKMSTRQWMTNVYLAFDWSLPGQFESFGYRKLFFEEQVCRSLNLGASQVLVMGGGYDTLCWRLAAKYPDVRFIEIDHPATSLGKQKGVQEMGSRANLTLLALDLSTRPLDEVLHEAPQWSVGDTSVIAAEGLLQYLRPEDVRATFAKSALCAGAESRFVFTHARVGPKGEPDLGPYARFNRFMLKMIGEPWLWAVEEKGLNDFLNDTGWRVEQKNSDIPVIGFENYAVAVRDIS